MITALNNHRNRSIWAHFRMRKTSGSMEKYNIISRCVIAGRACFPASRPGWFPTELVSLFPYRRPNRFLEFYKGLSSSLLEYPKISLIRVRSQNFTKTICGVCVSILSKFRTGALLELHVGLVYFSIAGCVFMYIMMCHGLLVILLKMNYRKD